MVARAGAKRAETQVLHVSNLSFDENVVGVERKRVTRDGRLIGLLNYVGHDTIIIVRPIENVKYPSNIRNIRKY